MVVRSPTSVALASAAKGNLSIILLAPGWPPCEYPLAVDEVLPVRRRAVVMSPTSVAVLVEVNEYFTISLEVGTVGGVIFVPPVT